MTTAQTTTPAEFLIPADELHTATERYPYLISVRGSKPVPARKEGHYFWCRYEVFLGIVWSGKDVRVLSGPDA